MHTQAICTNRGTKEDMSVLIATCSDTRLPRNKGIGIARFIINASIPFSSCWIHPITLFYTINPSCTY